ncbi:DNA endonuclease RBBP8-like [Hyalella azteca]|uniref:DNA endonuclease RBBP8-like n=1 Tax=Hyalella azteca TaxID=294128 RepID=A0A8B7NW29_HYAAZ|nr:DNA endonuclease RBBP8-like [Hyalella azteca]
MCVIFDRVPRTTASPSYAHQGAVERRRAQRRQLPGWSCAQCQQYYEGRNLSSQELAMHMNRCSKHRSKHKLLPNTPQDFWRPDMSASDDDDDDV